MSGVISCPMHGNSFVEGDGYTCPQCYADTNRARGHEWLEARIRAMFDVVSKARALLGALHVGRDGKDRMGGVWFKVPSPADIALVDALQAAITRFDDGVAT